MRNCWRSRKLTAKLVAYERKKDVVIEYTFEKKTISSRQANYVYCLFSLKQ